MIESIGVPYGGRTRVRPSRSAALFIVPPVAWRAASMLEQFARAVHCLKVSPRRKTQEFQWESKFDSVRILSEN
jgi:hypothetical protein